MRVLIVNSYPDRPLTRVFTDLNKSDDVFLKVICASSTERGSELEDNGVSVERIDFKGRIDFNLIRRLRRIMVEDRIEIVHVFKKQVLLNLMLAARGLDIRFVSYRGIIGHIGRLNVETWYTYRSRRMKRIISVCNAVRDYLSGAGYKSTALKTIYKGHDLDWYSGASRENLAEFDIPGDAFVVCFAGRMRKRKGIRSLLKAFETLKDQNIHLLLIGEVTDKSIMGHVKLLGLDEKVHFSGFRNNAADISGSCDAFIMPSLSREGLPRAVIEAMAQGVPAIVTDVGGMPEIVDNGEDGIIVEPGNHQQISSAIARLAGDADMTRGMGEKARAKIQARFNVDNTSREYLDLYREVMAEEL